MSKNVRINLTGRISGHAATMLGGWVEHTDDGSVFVTPYVDQAQLTGLLVQFSDLHVAFEQVAVESTADAAQYHPREGVTR